MTGWGFSARTIQTSIRSLGSDRQECGRHIGGQSARVRRPSVVGQVQTGHGGGGLCVRFGKEIQDHLPCQLEPRRDRIPQGMRSQVRLRQGLIRPARGGSLPSGVYQPGISIPDRDSRTVLNAGRHERSKQAFLFHFFRAWNDPFPGCLILHRTVSRTVFISNMPD